MTVAGLETSTLKLLLLLLVAVASDVISAMAEDTSAVVENEDVAPADVGSGVAETSVATVVLFNA